jgi:D-inositol-3-phosphate glycosyltransferase
LDQLHIALLSTHSCPWAKPGNRYTGGMNIYIQNLARELAQRGHFVDIYTSSHAGDEQCKVLELHRGIRLIHLNAADYSAISEINLDNHVSDLATSILSYCKDFALGYDLIHSHYWLSGLVGELLSEQWGIPHITMFHTLAKLKNKAGISILEPEFRIANEKKVIDSCDLIIASTENEKRELALEYDAPPVNISVIPCGINPTLFRPIDKNMAKEACKLDSRQTVLFVGRMDPLKGLSNLLEAISILQPRKDFQLLVIGGDNENEFEFQHMLKLIRDFNIEDVVKPIGSVPHEYMYLYYNAADFCVIPSYYESFSLVALESLACGTPILSANVGEVRDMVKTCPDCRIINDTSPAMLARHLNGMLDNSRDKNADRTGKLIDHYGWDSVIEKILSAYQQVMLTERTPKRVILHI